MNHDQVTNRDCSTGTAAGGPGISGAARYCPASQASSTWGDGRAHRGREPGVAEGLLDRDQVHAVGVQLAGAEMAQHVRRQLRRPFRQVGRGRLCQGSPHSVIAQTAAAAVPVLALGGEQRRAGTGVVGVEVAPHVLDEPPQRPPRPLISGCARPRRVFFAAARSAVPK